MNRKIKIVLGDNTLNFGILCADMLTKLNFDVITTSKDGVEVFNAIKEHKPHIVIMDVFMPHIDAIGIIKGIKCAYEELNPSFVVISSYENAYVEKETIDNGAAEYILKPFDIKHLCDRVSEIAKKIVLNGGKSSFGNSAHDIEMMVTDVIHQIGVPAHIKGYHYLRRAIILSIEDDEMINSVTKLLYPSVAKHFNTTPSRVERAIRHGIEVAWDRGDIDVLNQYFGHTTQKNKGKPTNSEFIALIADKIKLQTRKKAAI